MNEVTFFQTVTAYLCLGAWLCIELPFGLAQSITRGEELLISNNPVGQAGGRLVVSLRSEPKTLNPVTSVDISSREVIAQMTADLIHINRLSKIQNPLSPSRGTLARRPSIHFQTAPRPSFFRRATGALQMTLFLALAVYLDESVHSPQRDALIDGGKPIAVRR